MGFFDDDFFGGGIDDLFRRLSGEDGFVEYSTVGPDGKKKVVRKRNNFVNAVNLLDTFNANKRIFFIFDFGLEKEVKAKVVDELVKNNYGDDVATGDKVLEIKSGNKIISQFKLPEDIRGRGMESEFKNGILEVSFKK